jgi:periplasmic divalent cation tolerance protein
VKIDHCCIFCSCPNILVAQGISQHLTEHGLAACVNLISGVTSIFMWGENLNAENEIMMIIKTRKDHIDAIEQLIIENHPYDTPELIALPIMWGNKEYLDWMDTNTTSNVD